MIILGNVTSDESLFSLPFLEANDSFVPLFYDNIEELFGNNTQLKSEAETVCGANNFVCLFDYVLTKDTKAVTESQSSLKVFEEDEKILSK